MSFHGTREIANLIGISQVTLLNWESRGYIPRASQIGGTKRRVWSSLALDYILKYAEEQGFFHPSRKEVFEHEPARK